MDEMTFAVTTVAAALLGEASQDAYVRARDIIRRVLHRGGRPDAQTVLDRLDQDRARVALCSPPERGEAARVAAAEWASALEQLVQTDPAAYVELRALTGLDRPTSVTNQHNHGPGTFINGNVEGGLTINHDTAHDRDT
ncbi:hypothetical protein [Streptomyces roseochromogenus]|uniref:Uncharacterized protein n=1 Tax=Streptomyces roseochromogenus subsp. oscitans DS 12.976 TaxID=1352936 RepID=V6KCG9_STRRC|nr:hypothetical protein [Streptomyces roseochromogenus]EST29141.1 hypothetical protein M878_21010 [Streptomyces roseochromogenus subsp. oscitans DS 12.976]